MIPTFTCEGASSLPANFDFWTPRPTDIDEEGFGCNFRDTWYLSRVPAREARHVVELETTLLDLADLISTDENVFEDLASAIEFGDLGDAPDGCRTHAGWARLEQVLGEDEGAPFGGLEIGVAGLAVALASTPGCFPAASCRAHSNPRSWASHPVVLVACDKFRATRLAELLAEHECGFEVDPDRAELLVVGAGSVRAMNTLAGSVLATRSAFREPRARGSGDVQRQADHQPTDSWRQSSLDLGFGDTV